MSLVFANGFDFGTDEDAVRKHFGCVGAIKELYFQTRGSAVIAYEEESSASRAVNELHETTMEGQSRYVVVKLDERGAEGKGKGGKGKRPPLRGASRNGGGDAAASGRAVFVTGFDFETDDDALNKHFGKVGDIETFHFQSNRSAVITYAKESSAAKALTELDGTTMNGQTRYVDVKMNDSDRIGREGDGTATSSGKKGSGKGSRKGSGKSSGKAIYVSGFDHDTDEAALEAHFGIVGAIDACYFQSKNAAVITFSEAAAAQQALTELNGSTMTGQSRYVAVKLDNAAHKDSSKGKGKGKWW